LTEVKSIPAVAKALKEHLSLDAKEVLSVLKAGSDVYKGMKAEVS